MKKWTEKSLIEAGYEIENVKITSVDLHMREYCMVQLSMCLNGKHCCCYGGYGLGHATLSSKDEDFDSYPHGIEYLSRIMATVGVKGFNDLNGKYIRMASKGIGSSVNIIGNIIEDNWFDQSSFFEDFQKIDEEAKMSH